MTMTRPVSMTSPSTRLRIPCRGTAKRSAAMTASRAGISRRRVADRVDGPNKCRRAEHQADIGNIRADRVADRETRLAAQRGDDGNQNLGCRGRECDDGQADQERRNAQIAGAAGCAPCTKRSAPQIRRIEAGDDGRYC